MHVIEMLIHTICTHTGKYHFTVSSGVYVHSMIVKTQCHVQSWWQRLSLCMSLGYHICLSHYHDLPRYGTTLHDILYIYSDCTHCIWAYSPALQTPEMWPSMIMCTLCFNASSSTCTQSDPGPEMWHGHLAISIIIHIADTRPEHWPHACNGINLHPCKLVLI